jgi:hypothetical protein
LFAAGTRKLPARLVFTCAVSVLGPYLDGARSVVCTTDASAPFVVATHESQWSDCAGRLLREELFAAPAANARAALARGLENVFMHASRQAGDSRRHVAAGDVAYLVARFGSSGGFGRGPAGNADALTDIEFDRLWEWLGPTVQTLRFTKGLAQLWQQGLIYGLAVRDGVERALAAHGPGAFVIRFSDRYAGRIGVAFMASHGPKHYLIRTKDMNVSLADFILENPHFQTVLQVTGSGLTPMHKSGAFGTFTQKKRRKKKEDKGGYEPL